MKTRPIKNIGALNDNETCFGLGETPEEARNEAIKYGIEPEEVHELRIVTLTPESVAAIEAGNPDAVEIEDEY